MHYDTAVSHLSRPRWSPFMRTSGAAGELRRVGAF
jgi:hypothetical protein